MTGGAGGPRPGWSWPEAWGLEAWSVTWQTSSSQRREDVPLTLLRGEHRAAGRASQPVSADEPGGRPRWEGAEVCSESQWFPSSWCFLSSLCSGLSVAGMSSRGSEDPGRHAEGGGELLQALPAVSSCLSHRGDLSTGGAPCSSQGLWNQCPTFKIRRQFYFPIWTRGS